LSDKLAAVCLEHRVRTLCILGDLTDAKDFHSNAFTNRIADWLVDLYQRSGVSALYILVGNHDYYQQGFPNFKFMRHVKGFHYVDVPTDVSGMSEEEATVFMLPYAKHPAAEWHGLDFTQYQFVFMHQTVTGAIASNGQRMDGESLPDLASAGKVYSGDIHVPQVIGPVEYVGSPYQVHFGDNFEPRVVLMKRHGAQSISFKGVFPRRRMITVASLAELKNYELKAGDYAKVRLKLPRAEHHEWQRRKAAVQELLSRVGVHCEGIELVSGVARKSLHDAPTQSHKMTPAQRVLRYVERDELGGDVLDAGLELL